MKILVSRCLLGEPCRYDGRSVPMPTLERLQNQGHTLIPVCPEVLGGLSTPRAPSELQPDGRVVNKAGEDVTAAYFAGAKLALDLAKREGCTFAILKAKSPSCGSVQVYDGTFSGTLIFGQGVAARLMTESGISVIDETRLDNELLTLLSENKNPSKVVKQ